MRKVQSRGVFLRCKYPVTVGAGELTPACENYLLVYAGELEKNLSWLAHVRNA
ncbi:MAG: hypothetical protein A4E50_00853 [Methanosaeta sp. PtaB.Bin087]|jgi:hypothetical protein|nr:MAG: hypothetical protein A4E50_00853 [Methanosaeta sp. PtaB.Bin087]